MKKKKKKKGVLVNAIKSKLDKRRLGFSLIEQRPWGPFLESPEKPFVKLQPAYSIKLVFSYVVKGIKMKITAKFRASRRLRFEDKKSSMSPEMRPKSFGTFEKRAPVTF